MKIREIGTREYGDENCGFRYVRLYNYERLRGLSPLVPEFRNESHFGNPD